MANPKKCYRPWCGIDGKLCIDCNRDQYRKQAQAANSIPVPGVKPISTGGSISPNWPGAKSNADNYPITDFPDSTSR